MVQLQLEPRQGNSALHDYANTQKHPQTSCCILYILSDGFLMVFDSCQHLKKHLGPHFKSNTALTVYFRCKLLLAIPWEDTWRAEGKLQCRGSRDTDCSRDRSLSRPESNLFTSFLFFYFSLCVKTPTYIMCFLLISVSAVSVIVNCTIVFPLNIILQIVANQDANQK